MNFPPARSFGVIYRVRSSMFEPIDLITIDSDKSPRHWRIKPSTIYVNYNYIAVNLRCRNTTRVNRTGLEHFATPLKCVHTSVQQKHKTNQPPFKANNYTKTPHTQNTHS